MFKGYRTVIFNVLAAAVPILQMSELVAVIPPEWLNWYLLGVALANVALRAITTTPLGRQG